jgi:predicted GNAT family acetyltransferase
MADGLLSSIGGAIKDQYETTKRGLGLLVNDPSQFTKEAVARYFPTKEEVAQFRAIEKSGGDTSNTPYMQKMFNLAQFQGSIKPTGLLTPNQQAMSEIRKIQSERTPTDLSWANNPMTAEPPRIANALPLEDIVKNAENANVKLDISNKNGVLNISKIVVPKEQRGSGIGSSIMRQLSDYADATGTRLTLSPSVDFGATSVSRLKDFYKRFGFVENKGRNKDFSTRETMYREAQK